MLSKFFGDNNDVMSFNKFFNVAKRGVDEKGNDLYKPLLTTKEYYIYFTLYTKRMMDKESMLVNVHLIHEWLIEPFSKSPGKNKQIIRECLKEMIDNKVYIVNNEADINNLKNDTYLELLVNKEYLSNNIREDGKASGFELIPYSSILFYDMNMLYIYAATARFSNKDNGYICSYSQWAEILECSERKAIDLINKATGRDEGQFKEDPLIYVNVGGYREGSRTKQEVNAYSIFPFSKEEKKQTNGNNETKAQIKQNRIGKHGFGEKLGEKLPF